MRPLRLALILSPVLVTGCAPTPDKQTLAELRSVPADTADVHVDQGLDRAMESYRRYLEETPKTAMTPEAMRRLADLKVEKQFGILGDGKLLEIEAPQLPVRPCSGTHGTKCHERRAPEGRRHRRPVGVSKGFRASFDRANAARVERSGLHRNRSRKHRRAAGIGTAGRRSLSTINCSPSIRRTSITTRCCIRSPERTTSWDAPRRRCRPWSV